MKIKNLIPWIARGLSVLLTLGLYAFIFELTPPDFEWPSIFLAAIPGTVLLIVTAVAWNFPRPGGLIFILLGLLYAVLGWYRVSYLAIGIIGGGLILAGVGFLFGNGKKREQEKEEKKESIESKPTKFEEVMPTPETMTTPDSTLAPLPALESRAMPQPIHVDELDLEPVIPESTVMTPPTQPNVFTTMVPAAKPEVIKDVSIEEEKSEDELFSQTEQNVDLGGELPPLVSRTEQVEAQPLDDKTMETISPATTGSTLPVEEIELPALPEKIATEVVEPLQTTNETETGAEEPPSAEPAFTDVELPPLVKSEESTATDEMPNVSIFDKEETDEPEIEILGEEKDAKPGFEEVGGGIDGFDDAQLVSLDAGSNLDKADTTSLPADLPASNSTNLLQRSELTEEEDNNEDLEIKGTGEENVMAAIDDNVTTQTLADQGVTQSQAGNDFLTWFKPEDPKAVEDKTE